MAPWEEELIQAKNNQESKRVFGKGKCNCWGSQEDPTPRRFLVPASVRGKSSWRECQDTPSPPICPQSWHWRSRWCFGPVLQTFASFWGDIYSQDTPFGGELEVFQPQQYMGPSHRLAVISKFFQDSTNIYTLISIGLE